MADDKSIWNGTDLVNSQVILIATKNKGKASELAALLNLALVKDAAFNLNIISLADWEISHEQTLAEPLEGAENFAENAAIKARYYAKTTGLPALADDSGLSVSALNGEPGVLSARYGGPGLDDAGRCRFLLKNLEGQSDRQAFFTSVLALADPVGEVICWSGQMEGMITESPRGNNGFGYDPIFFYPSANKTTAEMTAEEKNAVSHRSVSSAAFLADAGRVRQFLNMV